MKNKTTRQKSNRWQDDFHTQKAQKEGYVARSVYKLEEIDLKVGLFDGTIKTVLDIGAAPGSWLQYVAKELKPRAISAPEKAKIIGIDLKHIDLILPGVTTYTHDATDQERMQRIVDRHKIKKFDVILSDMAPDTTSNADLDALRSIAALQQIMRIVEKYLATNGKFVFKVFMGPGFDEFVKEIKTRWGADHIRLLKPAASRKASKETFIIKS